MKILINLLNFRPGQIGGAETYIRALIRHLPGYFSSEELKFLLNQQLMEQLNLSQENCLIADVTSNRLVQMRLLEALTYFRARKIERIIESYKPDLILYPQQSLFPKYATSKQIMTIVDIQHLLNPQLIPLSERIFRRGIYGYSLSHAEKIIAISQFTKQTLIDHQGVLAERIEVIPLGFEPPHVIKETNPTNKEPYLFYPAATFPHKNHLALIDTIAILYRQGEWNHHLVFTGKQTPHWKAIQKRIKFHQLDHLVTHEGFVSRERINQFYQHAEAVLFPTLFEGFGIPILEANAFGKTIIASDIPVFREIGMPSQFLIDFSEPDQLKAALSQSFFPGLTKQHHTWQEYACKHADLFREMFTNQEISN